MSEDKKKPARFDLSVIRQQKTVEAEAAPVAQALPEETLEQFGSHMLTKTKRALKQAAAREGRKQYETLHDAVTEYLKRHHNDLLE